MCGTCLVTVCGGRVTNLCSLSQGALVSALTDDSIHLWNLRQKLPAVLHSLKFNRER